MDEKPRGADERRVDQARLLELQLAKVRREALAARLEARAAQLEIMIWELLDPAAADRPTRSPPTLESWRGARSVSTTDSASAVEVADPVVEEPDGLTAFDELGLDPNSAQVDSKSESARPPIERRASSRCPVEDGEETNRQIPPSVESSTQTVVSTPAVEALTTDGFDRNVECPSSPLPAETPIDGIEPEPESAASNGKRRRPAAWLISALVHVGVVIMLAAVGLQANRPKDQIAFSATTAEPTEVAIETVSIETTEPQPEITEPTPSETAIDLGGELKAAELVVDAPPAPPVPLPAAISSSAASAAQTLQSDSEATTQFCGVEGGGNHFVYLVDSSGSMGDGFESARAELLSSIAALKSDQRFYVIFFDADSDYMRLSNPKVDEARSVLATDENKASLRRWATQITMDRGLAPYEPLRFALDLKPDVIFLLSDGLFPQGIEDLLREENRVANAFGDVRPISIVHTISYHSTEGESRMRRIAEQNRGQYRHIPKG